MDYGAPEPDLIATVDTQPLKPHLASPQAAWGGAWWSSPWWERLFTLRWELVDGRALATIGSSVRRCPGELVRGWTLSQSAARLRSN